MGVSTPSSTSALITPEETPAAFAKSGGRSPSGAVIASITRWRAGVMRTGAAPVATRRRSGRGGGWFTPRIAMASASPAGSQA